jgi:hypothetical protein
MSRWFDEDEEASAIAQHHLREFSHADLCRIHHLGSVNIDLVCARYNTIPHVLRMAANFEAARRRAYPNSQIGRQRPPAGAASEPLDTPSSGAPHYEIGAPVRSEAAGPGSFAPPICHSRRLSFH